MNDNELLLSLFAELEREGAVSIPQSALLFNAEEADVEDALKQLVHCYDSVGERLELHGSYAALMRAPGESSRMLRLTREESDVLLAVLTEQGYPAESPLSSKLMEAAGWQGKAPEGPRIAGLAEGGPDEHLAVLAAACEDPAHHLVRILYRAAGAKEAAPRVVEPHEVLSDGDYRYLAAWCREADGWREFRLDRIEDAKVLDDTFEPRGGTPDFGLKKAPETARVAFAPDFIPPEWPGLEGAGRTKDGWSVARVPWYGTSWLPLAIVSCFGKARALGPESLVVSVREHAEKLLEGLGA